MSGAAILLFVVSILVMLVGLAGVIIPILPGIPLILGVAFVYDWIHGFEILGWQILVVLAILTISSFVLDWLAGAYGTKKMGGSFVGMVGSIVGMFIGLLAGGVIGLLIGAFVGAFVGELLNGKTRQQALRAGFGSFVGSIAGGLLKFVIGATMIGLFIWQVFW